MEKIIELLSEHLELLFLLLSFLANIYMRKLSYKQNKIIHNIVDSVELLSPESKGIQKLKKTVDKNLQYSHKKYLDRMLGNKGYLKRSEKKETNK